MDFLKRHSFFIFLFLTIILGTIIFSPYANFQDLLAQGDHGRELYAAQAVLRGEIPYKDFFWFYGPLMPYYYAVFFKLFGTQITSILLGKMVLNIACGTLCFLAVCEIFSPAAAFAASLWWMCFQQDFFFTYDHVGGVTLILAGIWMHFAYIRHSRIGSAYAALGLVFLLGLVKINFGVIALLMTILIVNVFDRVRPVPFNKAKRSFYITALSVPLAWLAIYRWMTYGLTVREIRECLPYLPGDEPNNHFSFIQTIPMLYHQYLHQIHLAPVLYAVALIIFICLLRDVQLFLVKKNDSPKKIQELFLIIYAALFYFLNLNEYLVSGVYYRSFWAQPPGILLCAFIIIIALNKSSLFLKRALWTFFVIICLFNIKQNLNEINAFKTPEHFLGLPKAHVYIGNDPDWIQTVEQTTLFINRTLAKEDLFFALPCDGLYYFLTNKRSPTRQLIFFQHIKIPAEQEQRIIAELKKNQIKMVLLSSRQSTPEPGRGTFGKTYCPGLYNFIKNNFYPVAQFGEWTKPAGWIINHGTMLLKLKD
mgnify:CR=1 FL=1